MAGRRPGLSFLQSALCQHFEEPWNKHYQIWTPENHAVEISVFIKNKTDYIHNNPVRAGWVEAPEDYIYSSAKDDAGKKGLLQLTMWQKDS